VLAHGQQVLGFADHAWAFAENALLELFHLVAGFSIRGQFAVAFGDSPSLPIL